MAERRETDIPLYRKQPPRSSRPRSRILPSTGSPELPGASRLSRSHTMMYPPGSVPHITPVTKPRSPTSIGQFSPKRLPNRTHGSVDNGDFLGRGFPANSQTLTQLHRTQTTKPTTNVYGKNMWDDDEYVDTRGNSVPRTPTGGPTARRINQQRKVQAQAVKLPDNPFIDSDYADMTGHQRNENGMEKLRSTHQYKSMKVRSQSASRFPLESETDGMTRQGSDVDLVSRDRNLSVSSSRSGSGNSRIKRSDTSPAFRTQGSMKENSTDVQRNESVNGVRPVIVEVDSAKESSNTTTLPLINDDMSGHTVLLERQTSLAKSTLGGRIHISSHHAVSPAHSAISTETATSFLKPSAPGSPVVVYKNSSLDSNPDNSHVAIVVGETKPTSPMYGSFANNSQKSDDKSTLKFDASPPRHRAKTVALISLAIILIVGMAATVVALVVIVIQQNDKIARLEAEIVSFQSIAAPASTSNSDLMKTKHVTDSSTTSSFQNTNAQPPIFTTTVGESSLESTAVTIAAPSDDPSTISSIFATTVSPGTTSAETMTTLQKTTYAIETGTTGSGNDTTT